MFNMFFSGLFMSSPWQYFIWERNQPPVFGWGLILWALELAWIWLTITWKSDHVWSSDDACHVGYLYSFKFPSQTSPKDCLGFHLLYQKETHLTKVYQVFSERIYVTSLRFRTPVYFHIFSLYSSSSSPKAQGAMCRIMLAHLSEVKNSQHKCCWLKTSTW